MRGNKPISSENSFSHLRFPTSLRGRDKDKGKISRESHFLFTCLNFTIHRASLAVDIINILRKYNLLNLANNAKFYLYGHRELSSEDNKKVLSCTIRYVKNSGRFTR